MERIVYVVTHGDKFSGANPRMTPEGFEQVAALRQLLPENPPAVVCGTGWRHLDVALALDLEPTRYTSAVGGPDSLETVEGKKAILLADGTPIDPTMYTTLEDSQGAMLGVLRGLPNNSVVCAGRPSMIMLGEKGAKSGAVYKVTFRPIAHVVEEVVATGVTEEGTV